MRGRIAAFKRAAATTTTAMIIGAGSLTLPPFYVPPPVRVPGQHTKEDRGRWPENRIPKFRSQTAGFGRRR
jgi:hypothetical protein